MVEHIGSLVLHVPTCGISDHGETAFKIFEDEPSVEGVVVLDDGKPAGLLMRNHFYQAIGKQFGRAIFLGRPVGLMMNRDVLVVDMSMDIAEVGLMAVSRPQEFRYDFVLVTRDGNYAGAVSISLFLTELYNRREREIELLRQKQDILERANAAETSHRLVIEEKNRELTAQKDTTQSLLDNAGQGFLSFGEDLYVQEGSSQECSSIFGFDISHRSIVDILSPGLTDEDASTLKDVFTRVFQLQSAARKKIYLSLLPHEIPVGNKIIQIEYKALTGSHKNKIMLILTDITKRKELEQKMAEEQQASRLLLAAVTNYNDLFTGIESFNSFFVHDIPALRAGTQDNRQFIHHLLRGVHTLKGDFSQLHMSNTAARLHELENQIITAAEERPDMADEALDACLAGIDPERLLEKDIHILHRHLGKDYFDKSISFSVSKEKILSIEDAVRGACDMQTCSRLLPLIKILRYENLKQVLARYDTYVQNLAERLGKKVYPLSVNGDDIFLDTGHYTPFIKSLTHVLRNALDHGIESIDDRETAGKDIAGHIVCDLRKEGPDAFCLSILDDGKGLDTEKITSKALDLGIFEHDDTAHLDRTAIYNAIFLDRFSTKDSATSISGRGVGLSSVREIVERFGGSVSVTSIPGKSTQFSFYLPLHDERAENDTLEFHKTAYATA